MANRSKWSRSTRRGVAREAPDAFPRSLDVRAASLEHASNFLAGGKASVPRIKNICAIWARIVSARQNKGEPTTP